MGKISGWRVLAGGILAGLVILIEQGFVSSRLLASVWQDMARGNMVIGMAQAGRAITATVVIDLAIGILIAWLYAAVRPRLGAGLKTALVVGLVAWLMVFLQYAAAYAWMPGFRPAVPLSALGDLFGYLVGAAVAGWVYAEKGDGAPVRRR
jgi:hypothetical protein